MLPQPAVYCPSNSNDPSHYHHKSRPNCHLSIRSTFDPGLVYPLSSDMMSALLARLVVLGSILITVIAFAGARPTQSHAMAATLLQNHPNTADSLYLEQPSSHCRSLQSTAQGWRRSLSALKTDSLRVSMSEAIGACYRPAAGWSAAFAGQRRRQIGRTEDGPITVEMRAEHALRESFR